MTSLVLTLTETLRYRGAVGQWSWVLHRVTGLGVVLFIILHIIDTSWAVFYPDLYVKAIAAYQSPLFTIGEFALVACVVYHAYNGLRIILFDARPLWWRFQQRAAMVVLAATALTLIPVFILMFNHVLKHYSDTPLVLPLGVVLLEQVPFGIGMVLALVAGLALSGLYGAVSGGKEAAPQSSRAERFWWSFMRLSGILIIPLVFGHLAGMHVVQGVFDIQGSHVLERGIAAGLEGGLPAVGANIAQVGVNSSGTAVEFVGDRWNTLVAGVAIWRLYDAGLLALVVVHGFNGLRYVLTDYTMSSPLLRRGMIFTCVIGATILLVLGSGMLVRTIDSTAIEMARNSLCRLYEENHTEVPEVLQCAAETGQ
ncbi:MAG: succinate dehydrogenase, cytochrome b556 subunit [Chloroflexi bacterium]|nr:succinate dehydrogenase, cytochrome b556 subunit [Chloroflexota bacterium]